MSTLLLCSAATLQGNAFICCHGENKLNEKAEASPTIFSIER